MMIQVQDFVLIACARVTHVEPLVWVVEKMKVAISYPFDEVKPPWTTPRMMYSHIGNLFSVSVHVLVTDVIYFLFEYLYKNEILSSRVKRYYLRFWKRSYFRTFFDRLIIAREYYLVNKNTLHTYLGKRLTSQKNLRFSTSKWIRDTRILLN